MFIAFYSLQHEQHGGQRTAMMNNCGFPMHSAEDTPVLPHFEFEDFRRTDPSLIRHRNHHHGYVCFYC